MKNLNLNTITTFQKIVVNDSLILRPLELSDAARLLKILEADPSIRKRVSVAARIYSAEDVASEIEKYKGDDGLIRYTILENDLPIGMVSFWRDSGFFGTEPNQKEYGFGYFLDPAKRGHGIVTSAMQKLMTVALEKLDVQLFAAFCEDDNPESRAVLVRLGFTPTEETFSEPTQGWVERKYVKKVGN